MTYIENLIKLLSIPSVYDSSTITKDYPYGKAINDALDFMQRLANEEGFESKTYAGHALSIQYGKQLDRIDIVSHLDVVQAKEGWSQDPFVPIIKDGKIIARGSQDMKSLALLMFYVLKDIKDKNIVLNKQVRLVYGTDEERTMKDIEYYIKKAGEPEFAFTPDGYFPFSIGEKGALMWIVEGYIGSDIEINGGVQCNVVSPFCVVKLSTNLKEKVESTLKQLSLNPEIKYNNTHIEIEFNGKAAHASKPDLGHNANIDALQFLSELKLDLQINDLYHALYDSYGVGCNNQIETPEMGKLTMNLGILKIENRKVYCEIDCRYPYGIKSDELSSNLRHALGKYTVTLPYDAKPILNKMDSPYLQILLSQYRLWSNDKREPVVSGGVTYSKVIRNCVAFGPMVTDIESLAHQKDESIDIAYLESLFPLYRDAIIALANLQEKK
jgi:succinyl-diaminopimelate desuccinylase